jgi:DNA-binding beta-propeller fold protein YncE
MYTAAALVLSLVIAASTNLPVPQPAIRIPRVVGAFDYMLVDDAKRRLLIAHTSSRSLAIFDLRTGTLERQIYLVGFPHGVAIDLRRDLYLVGTSGEPQVVEVDRRSLTIAHVVRMPGSIDAVVLDTHRDRLYADEDNGQRMWLVDSAGHIAATINTPQDSDAAAYDPASDLLYQNFTTINSTLVLDPLHNRIVKRWSTLPATRPHGLAVDEKLHVLYAAGTNGWLSVINLDSGAVIATARMASNVDQIALDAKRRRLYCASGDGFVSALDVTSRTPALLANIRVPAGAHTLAVDPTMGDVWIAYGTERDDFIMKLSAR